MYNDAFLDYNVTNVPFTQVMLIYSLDSSTKYVFTNGCGILLLLQHRLAFEMHISYYLDAYIEEIVNLTWHVDPPSFPIGSNEEIKLNDMAITRTRYEKCAGPYPMFRGSGNCQTNWQSNCQEANFVAKDDTLSAL